MHVVSEIPFDVPCRTRVWISRAAGREIAKFRRKGDPNGAFWNKLKRYAQNGFGLYEGNDKPVRHEWDGVYRVGSVDTCFASSVSMNAVIAQTSSGSTLS